MSLTEGISVCTLMCMRAQGVRPARLSQQFINTHTHMRTATHLSEPAGAAAVKHGVLGDPNRRPLFVPLAGASMAPEPAAVWQAPLGAAASWWWGALSSSSSRLSRPAAQSEAPPCGRQVDKE